MKISKPHLDDNSLLKKLNYTWIKCMFFIRLELMFVLQKILILWRTIDFT